jgi:type IV secretion system protein VirD4
MMAKNSATSSFDYAELKRKRVTVYLILPPHRMVAQENWLRLHVSSAFRAIVRQGLGGSKVRFVLDEAASLGHMDAVDTAIALYRGYNISIHSWFQSMGQLKAVYPEGKEQVLLGNCALTVFGVNDNDTAKYVSDRLGEATIAISNFGKNTGGSRNNPDAVTAHSHGSSGRSWGETESTQQLARRLLKPEEVMRLPSDPRTGVTALTFPPGVPPIMTTLVPYYRNFTLSLWRRFTGAVKQFVGSVCFLGICLMLAVILTGIGMEQSQPTFQNDANRFVFPEHQVFPVPEQRQPRPAPVNPYWRR